MDQVDDTRQAGADVKVVEAILRDAISLAKPDQSDDFAFLEWQVPDIAKRIVLRLQARFRQA